MSREIKFRGKKVDNSEWVYGSLVKLDYHDSIDYVEESQIVLNNGHVYKVFPDTVGEFTGLHDKNGKDLFEGDVVRLSHNKYKEISDIAAIEYCEGKAAYELSCTVNLGAYGGHNLQFFCETKKDTLEIEVIGNVYENPELLEVPK